MRSIGIINKRSTFIFEIILIFMPFSGCQKSCEKGYKPPSTLIDHAESPPVEKDLAYYQNFLKTNWDSLKDKARIRFDKLMPEDIHAINGNFDVLSDKVQNAYQESKEVADRRIKEFLDEQKI